MKKILSIIRLDFLPEKVDLGLLLLRVWLGSSMLILHGWGKLSTFDKTSRGFMNLFGIGREATLGLAVFGEVVCSLFLIFGFFARTGALGLAITMGVAFTMVHKGVLKGTGSGEMAFIYLAGFLTLLLTGPGRYSIEGKGGRSGGAKKPKPAKD